MATQDLVLYDEEFQKIKDALQRLLQDANANVVFLVDKNGQQIAAVGDMKSVDTTSLASLTAGNVAATDGLARLIGEKEFSILFHEGEKDNIHISIVAQRVILVVIFDERWPRSGSCGCACGAPRPSSTGSSRRSRRRSSAKSRT